MDVRLQLHHRCDPTNSTSITLRAQSLTGKIEDRQAPRDISFDNRDSHIVSSGPSGGTFAGTTHFDDGIRSRLSTSFVSLLSLPSLSRTTIAEGSCRGCPHHGRYALRNGFFIVIARYGGRPARAVSIVRKTRQTACIRRK
jgi:hypothetical protein